MQRLFNRLQEMGISPELEIASVGDRADNEESSKETSADRVIRHAAGLRAKWSAAQCDDDLKLPGNLEILRQNCEEGQTTDEQVQPVGTQEIQSIPNIQVEPPGPGELPFGDLIDHILNRSEDDAPQYRTNGVPIIQPMEIPHEAPELDVEQFILDVLRISPQPLKAKEIRSRICERSSGIDVDTSAVNSLLYGQLFAQHKVDRIEEGGTVRWKLSAEPESGA